MSSVTMCDFCMATTRNGSDMKKVKLPKAAVPDALGDVGSGEERAFDVCGACSGDLADALGEFLARRLGALGPEATG